MLSWYFAQGRHPGPGQRVAGRRFAERLVVSVKTVEFHLTNAFRRLDVSTRAELRHVVRRTDA